VDYSHPAGALLRFRPEKDISQGDADRFALHRSGSSGSVRAGSGTARHRFIPQEVGVKGDETMLRRLKQMLIKEFIQVFRDKRTRFLLFGPPIIQMLIFGYAATFEIYHVPTVVLDLDHSQESRELISRFSSSPYFDVQRQLTDYRQVGDLLDQGKATIGLEIHAGFAQNLRKGQTAPLQVILDATNSNTALIASSYVTQIALGFAQDYQKDRISRILPQVLEQIPSVQLEQRPWYNPDLRSRWFFVPGIIGSLTLVLVVTLTAFAVVREREIGTLEQLMVTPIRPSEFILGKTLPYFLIGLFDVSLIATVGTFWFEVPFRGHILVLFAGAILFLLSMLGVGLLISTVSSTQQQAMVTSFFFIMPAVTFSGFGFPISTMPKWLQYLTYLSPLRYFLVVLRGTYLKGVGMGILWPQMLAMALGTSLLLIAVLRFHKALD
jgi:ABC-2 type transport system permease protein